MGDKFLDKQGLSHFWDAVKDYVNQQGSAAGTGVTIEDNTISVTTPVRGIYTPEEYNTLPEDQKNSGLYIINDGAAGGSEGEVYSTEETRIGTWIDGKPLYRRVVIVQKVGPDTTLFSDISDWEVDAIVRLDGVFYNIVSANPNSTDSEEPITHFYNTNNYGAIFVDSGNKIYGRNVGRISCSARVYVEYTKTTDGETTI